MDDDTVYRRTRAGQAAMINGTPPLSAWEQRFLGMVTGHTPLRVLLDLCPDDVAVVASLQRLLGLRLIEVAEVDVSADAAVAMLAREAAMAGRAGRRR